MARIKYTDLGAAFDILKEIYINKAYVSIVMANKNNKHVQKLVYCVLDNHYLLNVYVDYFCDKGIKPSLKPLMLLNLYMLYILKTPVNVILNETKECLEYRGKSGVFTFFAGVINNASKVEVKSIPIPKKSIDEVKYNLPSWVIGMYKKEYPNFEEILSIKKSPYVHIVLNNGESEDILNGIDYRKTPFGFLCENTKELALLEFFGKVSYMSLSAAIVARSIPLKINQKVLDVCAAPGAKSCLIAQCGAKVTACDIYPHRLDLIKKYAERVKIDINIVEQDATIFNKEFENSFDVVLADVPCSGFGLIGKKRDIMLNKTYEDILSLQKLQQSILDNVSRYVKKGGRLVYTTTSVFKKENSDNIEEFLNNHKDFSFISNFKLEGVGTLDKSEIQLLTNSEGMEGVYLCHLILN